MSGMVSGRVRTSAGDFMGLTIAKVAFSSPYEPTRNRIVTIP